MEESKAQVFKNFPTKEYDILLIDPPWQIGIAGAHYPTLPLKELQKLEIGKISTKNSVLFLWVLPQLLVDGITLIENWGFVFVDVVFVWVKTTQAGTPKLLCGGLSSRRSCEFVLMGVKKGGKIPERKNLGVYQVVVEPPRKEFSRKPDCVRKRISQLFGEKLKKIELFARVFPDSLNFENWVVWGDEIE